MITASVAPCSLGRPCGDARGAATQRAALPERPQRRKDLGRCTAVVGEAADALGGLDLLVVAIGVAACGPADVEDEAVIEQLLAVHTLAPMPLVRGALPRIGQGGAVTVLTPILADHPTAGTAAYSAGTAAISGWPTAVRPGQRRRGVTVFDVRRVDRVTGMVLDGLRDGRRELRFDLQKAELALR